MGLIASKSVSNITTGINSFSNIALINPQTPSGYQAQSMPNPPGNVSPSPLAKGFVFHYEGENTLTAESDITDSYVEKNSAIADQISLKPEIISVSGFIGELTDILPFGKTVVDLIQSKLQLIGAYAPGLTTTALVALNEAVLAVEIAANLASTAAQTVAFVSGGSPPLTKQQYYFGVFYNAWFTRTLFTVQTPWALFDNMAIKTLKPIQDEETRMITNFEITFKKMRFVDPSLIQPTASSNAIKYNPNAMDGRAGAQASAATNQGNSALNTATKSFSAMLGGMA